MTTVDNAREFAQAPAPLVWSSAVALGVLSIFTLSSDLSKTATTIAQEFCAELKVETSSRLGTCVSAVFAL